MKKSLFFIAVAALLCTEVNAQDLACAFNTDNSFQTSLSEQPQTNISSIYSLPMPTTDFATSNQFNTQQYASAKGWGIASIVAGGVTMLGGATLWLWGALFSTATEQAATMDANMAANMAANMDPNMDPNTAADMAASMENNPQDPNLQRANNVGKGVKIAGIIGTAVGAVLVGTGIVLLTSNSGGYSRSKSTRPHRVRRKGPARSNPRHAELLPDYGDMQPDWSLCLNVGPTSAGLTFAF
jgi:hypothetical protein